MGFEFIRTAAVDALSLPDTFVKGTKAAITAYEPKSATTSGYTKLARADTSKILFCHPYQAFSKGIYPQAGYVNVWQNPDRGGAFEYAMKQVMAYRRNQDVYVRVAYAKRDIDPAAAEIRQVGRQEVNVQAESNRKLTEGWNFTLTGPS